MTAKKTDWEQRLYEVAKDILVHNDGMSIDDAIKRASEFIERLKIFESDNNI